MEANLALRIPRKDPKTISMNTHNFSLVQRWQRSGQRHILLWKELGRTHFTKQVDKRKPWRFGKKIWSVNQIRIWQINWSAAINLWRRHTSALYQTAGLRRDLPGMRSL